MDSSSVMHRWCNKDFGRQGTLTASRSCHSEGRNYFSYSTIFGQWVDLGNNVVVIYNGSTTPTSSRYRLWKGLFPKDVHVFPYDDGGHGYYHGCSLVSGGYYCNFKDEDFTQDKRMVLLDYFASVMYERFKNITTSKAKGAENVSFEMWEYFDELCSIYKDCSPAKFLKYIKTWNRKADFKKMVKLLASGERDVKTITDAMFGEGSYQKYMDYCEKFRKADRNKQFMIDLCHRLGMSNPYRQWYERGYASNPYKPAQIRKMTAKQRNDVHFANLAAIEYANNADERKKKYNRNRENAFKWVVGYECDKKQGWCGYEYDDSITKCRNMYTNEEYDISGEHIYGFYWCDTDYKFNYDDFRKSEDKQEWMRNFYAKVKEVQDTRRAIAFLKKYGVLKEKQNRYDNDIYLGVTQEGARVATEEDMRVVNEFIARQDAYFAEQERIQRARELQRQREEEERERERKYQEQVKQEQIDECLQNGAEGCRDLWRKHLTSIHEAESYFEQVAFKDEGEFEYGGNILLRFNLDKTAIETSKGIKIPLVVCRKFYPIFKGWHENPTTFKQMRIETKLSGTYTIESYEDDILTAGCHDIAWTEMERMWNEIEKLENVA